MYVWMFNPKYFITIRYVSIWERVKYNVHASVFLLAIAFKKIIWQKNELVVVKYVVWWYKQMRLGITLHMYICTSLQGG